MNPGFFGIGHVLRSRIARAKIAVRSKRFSRCAVERGGRVESLEARQLLSTSWFVSPSGSDKNGGTLAAPFQTIQAAANVAQAGDYVEIETGTYHEEVIPKNSGTAGAPITYEAYNNENVTISGADPITGWSSYSGDVYQASMSWDLGEGNNEVFVDGHAINEARWPNTSINNLVDPTQSTVTSLSHHGNSYTIYNSSLSQPANYWQGAIIHIMPGNEWVAETDTVTSSAPGQVTFTFSPDSSYASYTLPSAGNPFYLTNSFKALDSNAEWYRDPKSGTLYMATPAGDNPAGHDIEVKHRAYAFDLTNKAYTTINNINVFSATIRTTQTSNNTILNGIHAEYLSQFLLQPKLWAVASNTGIALNGVNSVLENSTIAYSAGDGVFVSGAGSRVSNNVIHDIDYSGSDSAGVRDYGSSVQIDHNTIYNTGRDGIKIEASKVNVLYNTLHDIGLQVTEAGGIYTAGNNGNGSTMAYNNIYNMHSGGYGQTALFLDNYSSNYIVHDNTVSNVDIGIKLNFTSTNNKIYNNTVSASQNAVFGNYLGAWSGTVFQNNVFVGPTRFGSGATVKNNVTTKGISGTGAASFAAGASSSVVNVSGGTPPVVVASGGGTGGAQDSSTTGLTTGTGGTSAGGSSSGSTSDSGSTTTPGDPGDPTTTPSDPGDTTTTPVDSSAAATPAAPVSNIPSDIAALANNTATVAALTADITADRSAIVADTKQRTTMLAELAKTIRADAAAYHAANRMVQAAKRKSNRAKTPTIASAQSDTQVDQLLAMWKYDRSVMASSHHNDFTSIAAARTKLAADVKALKIARHG